MQRLGGNPGTGIDSRCIKEPVDKISYSKRIVDHAANDFFPVSSENQKIKPGNPPDPFSHFRICKAHIFQKIWRQYDFSGHIKSYHMNLVVLQNRQFFKCPKNDFGSMRITPVIVFCYRRTVSMASVSFRRILPVPQSPFRLSGCIL